MNRLLAIPAACCLVAYAALAATTHGPSKEPVPAIDLNSAANAVPVAKEGCNTLLSVTEAQALVVSLAGEYQRPWQQWQSSPHRLYSRAAPRPVPSISAEIQWASAPANPRDGLLLASIVIRAGKVSQTVPCVIDRTSGEATFFASGQWQTSDEWLKSAPLPQRH